MRAVSHVTCGAHRPVEPYLQGMDFERWFFTDDTPGWKRNTFRFLLVISLIALLGLVLVMCLAAG